MLCPVCNSQNLATSVKCFQCGTTLIHEATGHSTAYIKGARRVDSYTYGLVGAISTLVLAVVLLKTLFSDWNLNAPLICFIGFFLGGLAGRFIAWLKWRDLLRLSKSIGMR
jgi:ABC-type uncharacterized transport system permease subunit